MFRKRDNTPTGLLEWLSNELCVNYVINSDNSVTLLTENGEVKHDTIETAIEVLNNAMKMREFGE